MNKPYSNDASWLDRTQQAATAMSAGDAAWEATRAQSMIATQIATQVMGDDEKPDAVQQDIGRAVGSDQRELFVSCGPAEAMQQQFDIARPEFIVLHDLGCAISKRLLAGVATASGRRLQRLVIRRQGYGTPLATLEYIEWANPPGSEPGTTIRIYTTAIEADAGSRHALAHLLMARSRLAVIFIGELPAHALAEAMHPLEQSMLQGPWPNREMLLLPLTAGNALANQAARLGGNSGVNVRSTPQISRPAEAWSYVSSTWNRLREQLGHDGRNLPILASATQTPAGAQSQSPAANAPSPQRSEPAPGRSSMAGRPQPAQHDQPPAEAPSPSFSAPTMPLPLRPMPDVPRGGPREIRLEDTLNDYVNRLARLNGIVGCCVFDVATQMPLASSGDFYAPRALSSEGRVLFDAMQRSAAALGLPSELPEMAITMDTHHLVLKPVPRQPQLMLLMLLDKDAANLTLARLQIQRIDEEFD